MVGYMVGHPHQYYSNIVYSLDYESFLSYVIIYLIVCLFFFLENNSRT